MARSLGTHVTGLAPCYPGLHDPLSNVYGAKQRFLRKLPQVKRSAVRRVRSFTRMLLRKHLKPLASDSLTGDVLLDAEKWLETSHYPAWRKNQLLEAAKSLVDEPLCKLDLRCASFVKTESYPRYKHVRWINSRSDRFKVFCGPFFHLVEKSVFKGPLSKYFVKAVPVDKRPKVIKKRLYQPGCRYAATDFTAFEGSFGPDVVGAIEFQLYAYMAKDLPHKAALDKWLRLALTGRQTCVVHGTNIAKGFARMSGDMCTSLGNGFSNLVICMFVAGDQGWDLEKFAGIFEGDDGLLRLEGPVPPAQAFEDLGFSIKLDVHDDLGMAGFCQNYFDVEDANPTNLVDPLKYLAKVGWTTSEAKHGGPRVMRSLLRAKAYSLLFASAGSPVVDSLGAWLMRITEGAEVRFEDGWWEREKRLGFTGKLVKRPITFRSRLLVEQKFGVSVEEQFSMERYFDSLQSIHPIEDPLIIHKCTEAFPDWVTNWHLRTEKRCVGESW